MKPGREEAQSGGIRIFGGFRERNAKKSVGIIRDEIWSRKKPGWAESEPPSFVRIIYEK
jgi:hypothetical protein